MDVLGVRVEMPTNQPIVLLREQGTDRHLPIWIGAAEASAIAYAQQGVVPPRPLTHDLLIDVIGSLGRELSRVRITSLTDGAFHAVLELRDSAGTIVEVDSRSSDAIALALRASAEIVADEALLDDVGVRIPDADDEGEDETGQGQTDVLEEFTRFLDSVSPEDFGTDAGPAEDGPSGDPSPEKPSS